jgi:hypothetical protein
MLAVCESDLLKIPVTPAAAPRLESLIEAVEVGWYSKP